MKALVEVDAGICGFQTRIAAESDDMQNVTFKPTFLTPFYQKLGNYFSSFFIFLLHSVLYIRYIARMSTKSYKNLIAERTLLLAELSSLPELLRGSWVERTSVCSRPGCKCHRGERHGPRHYLVVNEAGRQKQKYVPNARVQDAARGRAQYRRLLEIADRITQLNLALMKEQDAEP